MLLEERKKRLTRLVKIAKTGDIGLLIEIVALEAKIEALEARNPESDQKEKDEIMKEFVEKCNKMMAEMHSKMVVAKGEKGDNYILTKKDRAEIASKIKIPVVEKVVERTEIVKEQPIVKEVAVADTGEQIVKKINDLEITPEKQIEIEHIKDLEGRLKKLEKRPIGSMSGGVLGRDLVKDVDISAQLDGVTTTFNIPAIWNVISVDLSSFPHALRKTIDFTYTSTSITFTSQIGPSTSLATGQTCVFTVMLA